MTQEEKSQAQDVLDGLLRDAYQTGYNQGFKDGLEVGESNKASKPVQASPTDGTAPIREDNSAEIKACLDCSHCHTTGNYGIGFQEKHFCRLASKTEPDPVTGRRCYVEKVHCWQERKDGQCGPEGRNWKPRKGLLQRIFGR